ncbi:MAG: outer membrane beta-barrel protein [Pseudomonadota bacterium]
MKKIMLAAAIAALSSTAFAGGSVGLGYQSSTVAPNYGDCWSECFGDGEPAGFALNASYDVIPNVFVSVDYADLSDEEDHYDWSVEVTQTRLAAQAGYRYALNDSSNVTAAVQYSSTEWSYLYTDPTPYEYRAEDNGVSLVLGTNTKVTDRLTTGVSFAAGFETGISAYVSAKLSDSVSLQTSYSRVSYELGDFGYYYSGTVNNPSSVDGDGDFQFNDENFRVSLNYAF